jgi:hypothetical protein
MESEMPMSAGAGTGSGCSAQINFNDGRNIISSNIVATG